MEIKVEGNDKLIGLESDLKELTYTSFEFYDLGDLHRRLNSQPIHLITQNIKESTLVEVVGFPLVVHALDLVRECIKRYNIEIK